MGVRRQDGREEGKETGPGGDGEPRRVLGGRGGHVSQRTWPQKAGPRDSRGSPAPFLANARAENRRVRVPSAGTLWLGLSPEVTRGPHAGTPSPTLETWAPSPASSTCGVGWGSPGGARGGRRLQSWEPEAMTPPPSTFPSPPPNLAPSLLAPLGLGARESPLYSEGNQCRINARFPGGEGGSLHKRCIVSIACTRLPPQHPARWRRPQGGRGRGWGGSAAPSLLLGKVGREAGMKEGRGEREGGREEGAGRLGEHWGGGIQSEGGGRTGEGERGDGWELRGGKRNAAHGGGTGEAGEQAGGLGVGGAGAWRGVGGDGGQKGRKRPRGQRGQERGEDSTP